MRSHTASSGFRRESPFSSSAQSLHVLFTPAVGSTDKSDRRKFSLLGKNTVIEKMVSRYGVIVMVLKSTVSIYRVFVTFDTIPSCLHPIMTYLVSISHLYWESLWY